MKVKPVGLKPDPQRAAGLVGRTSVRQGTANKVKPVGLKPDPQRARVLWVGLQSDKELQTKSNLSG